jgi:hypothetical protein
MNNCQDLPQVDVSTQIIRKSQKLRTCPECGHAIQIGEKYLTYSTLADGSWYRGFNCLTCMEVAEWLNFIEDAYCFAASGLYEELENSGCIERDRETGKLESMRAGLAIDDRNRVFVVDEKRWINGC